MIIVNYFKLVNSVFDPETTQLIIQIIKEGYQISKQKINLRNMSF